MWWLVNATAQPRYTREILGTPCIGGWVGLTAGLDRCAKSPPTGIRSPDRPARSESLYRLNYPGMYSYTHKLLVLVTSGFFFYLFLARVRL